MLEYTIKKNTQKKSTDCINWMYTVTNRIHDFLKGSGSYYKAFYAEFYDWPSDDIGTHISAQYQYRIISSYRFMKKGLKYCMLNKVYPYLFLTGIMKGKSILPNQTQTWM